MTTLPIPCQPQDELRDVIAGYIDQLDRTNWSTLAEAADRIIATIDAGKPPPAPYLSRDELIRIVAAAIRDVTNEPGVTAAVAVVHALHVLGALPIGGEPT